MVDGAQDAKDKKGTFSLYLILFLIVLLMDFQTKQP